MFHSLRWRLVASYMLLTLLITSLVGVLALAIVGRTVQQQEFQDLRANAQAVARQALPLVWSPVRQYELAQLAETASFLGSVRVRILDAHGEIMADSGLPSSESELVWIAPPPGEGILEGEWVEQLHMLMLAEGWSRQLSERELALLEALPPGTSFTVVGRGASPWGNRFTFFRPAGAGNPSLEDGAMLASELLRSSRQVTEPIGPVDSPMGFVELSSAPDYGAEALATTRRALLFAGLGALLVAGLVGLWISHRLASPLRSLQETARQMGAGDLSARASVRSKDEIGGLALQFNQMAGQMETSFRQLAAERDALRRFIADASHELRTPITALKNFNALLLGPAAGDPETQAEFLNESQAQITRLEWITRNLLDLSRLDAGLLELEWGDHDLREVITSAAAPFLALAGEKEIRLVVKPPDAPLPLRCDRARLEIVLANLLDNALKFTPPGGQVEISAGQSEGAIRLWVSDTGAGIYPEDLPHIFERFYRGRGTIAPGSGLGLSIVERLVQAQGGQVSALSAPGEGTRFILEWPARL